MDSHPRLINPYTRYYADNLPEPTAWSIRHCTHPLRLLAQAKVILANASRSARKDRTARQPLHPSGKSKPLASRISTTPSRTTWRQRQWWARPKLKLRRLRLPLKRPRSTSILPASLRPSTVSPGRPQLQVGALINPNSGPLTSVSTLDRIKVHFTVSERSISIGTNGSRGSQKWEFRLEPAYEKEGVKSKHFRPMFVAQALHPPLFGRFKSLQYFRPPFVYRNGWMSRRASPR